jgi:hypothetical protein
MSGDAPESPAEAAATEDVETVKAAWIHRDGNEKKEEMPVLDVHPAHHAATTWREFFVHIATIVLGLLIAVGLEQTVEYFHHHHQARHARETLAQEIEVNRKRLNNDLYVLRMNQEYLFADIPVIQRARTHKLAPGDLIVVWYPYLVLGDSAWQTAQASGSASLLDPEELRRFASAYVSQQYFNTRLVDNSNALLRAVTVFYRSGEDRFNYEHARLKHPESDAWGGKGEAVARAVVEEQAPGPDRISLLTPAQLDRLEQSVQEGIFEDDQLINVCLGLQSYYNGVYPDDSEPPQSKALERNLRGERF